MRNAVVSQWMKDVDSMFNQWPAQTWRGDSDFLPKVDVHETEKEYSFHFDLPGMSEKDLEIRMSGRELHVMGERHEYLESKDKKVHRSERSFGQFERTFLLPEDANAEAIDAKFKDGVLEIKITKVEAAQPKLIPIKVQ